MGGFQPKIGVEIIPQKMDGEHFMEKPYWKWDDLGGETHYFRKHPYGNLSGYLQSWWWNVRWLNLGFLNHQRYHLGSLPKASFATGILGVGYNPKYHYTLEELEHNHGGLESLEDHFPF